MPGSSRFPRRSRANLRVVQADDPLDEIRLVVDDYLIPAGAKLKQSADDGDMDAIRAYALELLAATGTIVAACPRARRAPNGGASSNPVDDLPA